MSHTHTHTHTRTNQQDPPMRHHLSKSGKQARPNNDHDSVIKVISTRTSPKTKSRPRDWDAKSEKSDIKSVVRENEAALIKSADVDVVRENEAGLKFRRLFGTFCRTNNCLHEGERKKVDILCVCACVCLCLYIYIYIYIYMNVL